jgi:hypothetical protein
MMNYLAELPFVDIFDAKANKAFSGASTIHDYKCGVNGAKTFVEFIEKYPFMTTAMFFIGCAI